MALPRSSSDAAPDRSVCPVRYQYEIQKAPYEQKAVAPKVFPFANSQMPATSCPMPPYARARPNTTAVALLSTISAFITLRTNVVRANAASPRGAGSAIAELRGTGEPLVSGGPEGS